MHTYFDTLGSEAWNIRLTGEFNWFIGNPRHQKNRYILKLNLLVLIISSLSSYSLYLSRSSYPPQRPPKIVNFLHDLSILWRITFSPGICCWMFFGALNLSFLYAMLPTWERKTLATTSFPFINKGLLIWELKQKENGNKKSLTDPNVKEKEKWKTEKMMLNRIVMTICSNLAKLYTQTHTKMHSVQHIDLKLGHFNIKWNHVKDKIHYILRWTYALFHL